MKARHVPIIGILGSKIGYSRPFGARAIMSDSNALTHAGLHTRRDIKLNKKIKNTEKQRSKPAPKTKTYGNQKFKPNPKQKKRYKKLLQLDLS